MSAGFMLVCVSTEDTPRVCTRFCWKGDTAAHKDIETKVRDAIKAETAQAVKNQQR